MRFSEAIDKFSPAFVKAQAECENAKKASENSAFKKDGKSTKYAGLPEVVNACLPACHANGIAVAQELGETIDSKMHITTVLLHTSGQWMEAHGSIPLPKADPQGYGSASTYARRYHLAAVMGVIQEDDDGNAATRPVEREIAHPAPINEAQFAELTTLIEQTGSDTRNFCTFYKVDAIKNLPADKFEHATKVLRNKLAPAKDKAA